MKRQIFFDADQDSFGTRAFSAVPNEDREAFDNFYTAISGYRLTNNGTSTQGLQNNGVEVLYDPQKKSVFLGVPSGSFADLSPLDGRFEPIYTKKQDRLGRRMTVSYKDYDILNAFFNMQVFGRDYLLFGPCMVRCKAKNFGSLMDGYNSFAKGLKCNFSDLKVMFPYATLVTPLSNMARTHSFSMDVDGGVYKAVAETEGGVVFSAEYHPDGRVVLSFDEGAFQKVMRPADYESMMTAFFKIKRFGIHSVEVKLMKPNSIYSSVSTLFKHLKKQGGVFNTY
jgi:hypothetical protein